MKIRFAAAICAVAVAAATLLAAPLAATAQPGTWRVVDQVSAEGSGFTDVSTTADQAWAVGDNGFTSQATVVHHYFHGAWQPQVAQPTPPAGTTSPQLTQVATPSDRSVWVSGGALTPSHDLDTSAFFAHWNGSGWYTHDLGTSWTIVQIAAFSPSNVWFLGRVVPSPGAREPARYVHWDGHRFSRGGLPALPYEPSGDPYFVPAFDPSTNHSELLHYNGTRFVTIPLPKIALGTGDSAPVAQSVLHRGPDAAIIAFGFVGNEGLGPGLRLYRYSAGTWTLLVRRDSDAPSAMAADGAGGEWVVSSGLRPRQNLLHISGDKVIANLLLPGSSTSSFGISALALRPGTRRLWGVGARYSHQSSTAQIREYVPS